MNVSIIDGNVTVFDLEQNELNNTKNEVISDAATRKSASINNK